VTSSLCWRARHGAPACTAVLQENKTLSAQQAQTTSAGRLVGKHYLVQGRTDQANPVKTDVIAWRWLYAEYLPESGSGTAETDASYSPYRPRGAGVCRAFLEGRGIAAASVGKDI